MLRRRHIHAPQRTCQGCKSCVCNETSSSCTLTATLFSLPFKFHIRSPVSTSSSSATASTSSINLGLSHLEGSSQWPPSTTLRRHRNAILRQWTADRTSSASSKLSAIGRYIVGELVVVGLGEVGESQLVRSLYRRNSSFSRSGLVSQLPGEAPNYFYAASCHVCQSS